MIRKILLWILLPILLALCGTWLILKVNQLHIPVEGGTLEGTLLRGQAPRTQNLVILASGSGPTDRDGNSPLLKGKNDSLKALAYALSAMGWDVYRFDQRSTIRDSEKIKTMLEGVTIDTLARDVVATIRHFKEANHYRKIVLIGHSQGAMVVSLAALSESVDGIINIAGAAEPIHLVLLDQLKSTGNYSPETLKTIENLLLGSTSDKLDLSEEDPVVAALLDEQNKAFMSSWIEKDPLEVATRLSEASIPQAFLFGNLDTQVPASSYRLIAQKNIPLVRVALIKTMNHVLKQLPEDDPKANLKSYSDPSYPLHPELIQEVKQFLEMIR